MIRSLHTFQRIIFNSFDLSFSIGSDATQQRVQQQNATNQHQSDSVIASQQPIQRQNETSQRNVNDGAIASTSRGVLESTRKRKRAARTIPNTGLFELFIQTILFFRENK